MGKSIMGHKHGWSPVRVLLLSWTLALGLVFPGFSQDVDPEEVREAAITARFVTVLEKNPRRGTALDRVYGFHVERGTLDSLIQSYRDKGGRESGASASTAWMIVGLLESLRGQDAAASEAFRQAEREDSANPLASYYLGQSLILVGQPDQAAEALERAVLRKPAPVDQLEIFQALGRVYQRAHKSEKALEVWNRLEQQFPNDARVQEQIATTLLEEGEFAAALPRFQALARTTRDKYRQSQFLVEAAEIRVRLGQTAEATQEFEKLLGELNPDNWLYRDVRRRIEQMYLRTDDQAGLIGYYEGWISRHPEDLEAVSRLSQLLAGIGRGREARDWLLKGLKSAPKRSDLRLALIEQYVYEKDIPSALAQYELLDKHEPNNPDTLREWGRLILKDAQRPEEARRAAASAVWKRLTAARPRDPLAAAQVADLFRQSELVDDALAMYRKAVELAPDQPQYKEYLGEYFHALQRKDEALATWKSMVEGSARTASNLSRLAEVLSGFGYLAEAIEANASACQLDPRDINLQIKQADLLTQAERYDDALKQLGSVKTLAATDEEREAWLQRELRTLQSLGTLQTRIDEARQDLTANAKSLPAPQQAERWYWLARGYEAQRQLAEAAEAIGTARELVPQSIPILTTAARILEAQNNLLGAIEIHTRLAATDRRYRTEYLKKIAQLEAALGRRDHALQAGRDLIAAAPGNPELYEFFSQLCFQMGESEEGLQALRRSVRVNPTEIKGLLQLAAALSDQFRTSEAIELYWRAFDKATQLDDRLLIVPRLTELYLQTNQLDRLLERLERLRREPDQHREMTICLAQAYQSAGDDGNARQELEKLLTDDTRDTQLLQQLVKLCEQDGDLESAIRFQQQLNVVAPSKEGTMRMAMLTMKSGDHEAATALLTRATAEEKDPEQLLRSLDTLLGQKNFEQVISITERLVRDQPRNWELLYRSGAALASTKPADAARRFQAILDLNLNDDDPSLAQLNSQGPAGRPRRTAVGPIQKIPPFTLRVQQSYAIRRAVGLESDAYYSSPGSLSSPFWSPTDFGTARMACLAWLNLFAKNENREGDFLKQWTPGEQNVDRRVLQDWLYLCVARNETKEQYQILRTLSRQPDADANVKSLYIAMLNSRSGPIQARVNPETGEAEVPLDPLDSDELEHVLKCFREIDEEQTLANYGQNLIEIVCSELKRAGRTDEAERMLTEQFESARTPIQIAMALTGAIQRNDFEKSLELLDRLALVRPQDQHGSTNPTTYAQYVLSQGYESHVLGQLMSRRAQKQALTDVLAVWDRYLKLAAARSQAKTTVARRRPGTPQSGGSQYYTIWVGNSQRGEQLDFPAPGEQFDRASIQMLRQLFVIYREAGQLPELLSQFQTQSENRQQPASQLVLWQLGHAYLRWWNDDKDEALALLSKVTEALPNTPEQVLELARLHEKRGDLAQALALVDSLTVVDQSVLQQREIAALRLSVNSGEIDRARLAAERLFGLRLDSGLQIQLARQMHQLGMHEQAEAVLSRAGRQAGNRTDVLVTLMQQYQSQGQNDVATQIAHQLLRRSPRSSSPTGRSGRDDSSSRQAALQILKRSGRLPTLIARVEEQLAHSPKSQKLLETLIEYYTADGNSKKVAELSSRYAETRGDDPQFRFQLAMQLLQSGKHAESLEHFKAALTRDPRLLRNSYWEIQNAFENADKLDDLAALYQSIDLKSFRQNVYQLTNLLDSMARREKSRDRAFELFRQAWKDLPDQRGQLLSNLNGEAFWKMPEIYDYARMGIIPTESSLTNASPWLGFGQVQSWSGEGKITTLLNRLLTMAVQSQKLDELATEVEQAQQKLKGWQAGEPLLALINLRRGRVAEGRAVFEKLLPTMTSVQQVGYYTHWEISQELSAHESCFDLAILYLETAARQPELMANDYSSSPARPLVALYKQKGRLEDARQVILRVLKPSSVNSYNNPQYDAYRRIRNAASLGTEIRNLGFPIDALRIYQQALANTEDLAAAQRYGGESLKRELNSGYQAAMSALKPESLPRLLETGTDESNSTLDLILLAESRSLDKLTMTSAMGILMTELMKRPGMTEQLRGAFQAAHKQRPEDLGLLVLEAKFALAAGDADQAVVVLDHLDTVLERSPLEAMGKTGYTAAQRQTAARQAALWLIARDCLRDSKLASRGIPLAERALEAARRQSDPSFALAILREWGQISLDQGDPTAAEQRWTQMLDIIIPPKPEPPRAERKTSAVSPPISGRRGTRRLLTAREQWIAPLLMSQVVPATIATPAPPVIRTGATRGNVVNLTQFERACDIAQLAAGHGMPQLSIKAVTQALSGGPPLQAMQAEDSGFGLPVTSTVDSSPVFQNVEARVSAIVLAWRQKKVAEAEIYRVLKQIVLPESRPLEVFLYPRPLGATAQNPPQSLGVLLAQAAVQAQQQQDLTQALEARLNQPLGELAGRILQTQLAMATGDSARVHANLDALATRLKQDSLQHSSELVCHVALPALTGADAPASALTLLERAVDHFHQNALQGRASPSEEPLRSLRFKLARHHFAHGNVEQGKRHLEEHLAFLTPLYRNYSGDYGQYRRKVELLKVAGEFAHVGADAEMLDVLGQYADLPVPRNYSQEGPGRAGALALLRLARLSPEQCYDVLKTWSLPTDSRRSVRVLAGLVPADTAPAAFDELRNGVPRGPQQARLFSTAEILVSAARDCGKLDELKQALQPHAAMNVENADILLLLTRIAQGDKELAPALNAYLDARQSAIPAQGSSSNRPQLVDAVLGHAALQSAPFQDQGRRALLNLFLHASRVQDHLLMAMMRHDYNASVIGRELADPLDQSPQDPGLKHWTAASTAPARTHAAGAVPMWWFAQEGLITHICGPDQSHLYLKYPLEGTFELSCDVWYGGWAEANIGFGGLVFQGLNAGGDVSIFPLGNRSDVIHKADPPEQGDCYHRVRLSVESDRIRYYVDDSLIHSESRPAGTAPWFFLHCDRVWQTCFRNIRITGQPTIPREVTLSRDNSLLGWSTDFYSESQPRRSPTADEANAATFDWWSDAGIIHGQRVAATIVGDSSVQQSRLYYDRPLLDGERLRYEFWYDSGAGAAHVHPALDRLAFLLQPEGVQLHWMTDGGLDDVFAGIARDNVLVDPAIQQGPVPLKNAAWNAVEIRLDQDTLEIQVNGTRVASRRLEPGNSRQFGFYHDKAATTAMIRNVVLSGDWPESLTPQILAELTAPARPRSEAERRLLAPVIEEKFRAEGLDPILLQTRALAPVERYAALKAWVLPGPDHTALRMYADTAPSDVLNHAPIHLPPVSLAVPGKTPSADERPRAARSRSGGDLIAPVLDLVVVARELGKLEELRAEVESLPVTLDSVRRGRLAFLVLIEIAAGQPDKALVSLKDLTPSRAKGLSDSLPIPERWPELVAAWEAARVPELRAAAVDLFEVLLDSTNRKNPGGSWEIKVRSARQHARFLLETKAELPLAQARSPKGQWTQSTQIRIANRARGMVPRWRIQGHETLHLGGEGNDLLYFQSPLRGSFSVEAELSTFGWREARLMYDAHWASPNYTLEAPDLGTLQRFWTGTKFAKKLNPMGDWCRIRMVVSEDRVTYFANEQQIHEHTLARPADPWLAIHSFGHYAAASRSVTILGQPEIPAELPLSEGEDLQSWWSDTYLDPVTGNDVTWKKDGPEIVGPRIAKWEGRSRESLLQYHRPMVEDGEITYEFYYVPGETLVHPALGRMALILADSGVGVHWMTDSQYERTGLTPEAVLDEPTHRRGTGALPWKRNQWNQASVRLTGDIVTISLNGQPVFERSLEPDNARTFGFFRYAGDTEARIRNVIYRGEWPRSLPSPSDQELAVDLHTVARFGPGELPQTYAWNFQGPQPLHLRFAEESPTTRRTGTKQGVKIERGVNPAPETFAAGYQWSDVAIGGDFEITLGYRDFQSTAQNENHQVPRMEIILALGGGFGKHTGTVSLIHRRNRDQSMQMTSLHGTRHKPPQEDWQASDQPWAASSGRIRIVRHNGMAYFLAAPADTEDWTVLDHRPVGNEDVRDLIVGARCEDPAGTVSAELTEFSVRARTLSYQHRFSEQDLPEGFHWNFQGERPRGLQAWGVERPNEFQPSKDGITLVRPGIAGQKGAPIGYQWQGTLEGDFEVTLDYHGFESTTDVDDWQVPRIEIHIPIGGKDNTPANTHTATISHRRRRDGAMAIASGVGVLQSNGQKSWGTNPEHKLEQSPGRLRLIRVGSMIHVLIAAPGREEFTRVGSRLASDAVVNSMSFCIRSESKTSNAKATFAKVSIRARHLESDQVAATNAPPPVPGPAPFQEGELSVVQEWNFLKERPAFLKDWMTRRSNKANPLSDGLELVREANVDSSELAVGFQITGVLTGDFEATLDYRDFQSTPVLTDWRVPRVDMSAVFFPENDTQRSTHSAGMAHRRNHDGEMRLLATQGERGGDDKFTYKTLEAPVQRDAGRLRLVRQGAWIYYQAAPSGSDSWTTVNRLPLNTGPARHLSIGLRAEDLQATARVVVTRFTLRTRKAGKD